MNKAGKRRVPCKRLKGITDFSMRAMNERSVEAVLPRSVFVFTQKTTWLTRQNQKCPATNLTFKMTFKKTADTLWGYRRLSWHPSVCSVSDR
jgi:hypothetical protein